MKKYISLIATLAFALFLMPGVLGALSITMDSSFTTAHNSHLLMPFNLTNTGSGITNVVLTVTNIFNPSGVLTSSLPDLNASSTSNHVLDYAIPQYSSAGTYPATINVSGNEGGTSVSATKDISIIITQSKTWTVSSPATITVVPGDSKSTTFTITNTGNVDLTNINIYYNATDPELEDNDNDEMTLSINPTSISTLAPGESRTITVTADVQDDMDIDEYRPKIYVTADGLAETKDLIVNVELNLCEEGERGNYLFVEIKEPDNGDDFFPGDIIPIDVKVRNSDDDDIDVVIVASLYDLTDDEWIDDEVDIEETINDDDSETFSLEYEVPIDVTKDHDYRLYLKAYEDGNEDEQCNDAYVEIDIKQNSHDIKIEKIEAPESAECGSSVDIITKLINIGRKDEEDIKLQIINSELDIDESKTFNIDEGDKRSVTTNIRIPEDAKEKTYTFTIRTYFHYSSDSYRDSVSTTKEIKVGGNCIEEEPEKVAGTISTELLTSTPSVGEQLSIKVRVFNTGDVQTTYTLGVEDYEAWARFDKIEPLVLTLDKNEAGTAYIYLVPKENISGIQTLRVKALYGSNQKAEKSVEVEIGEEEPAGSVPIYQTWATRISNLSGFDLATINAILIIAIILVIAWVVRVKKAY